jgi:hypothetical protein
MKLLAFLILGLLVSCRHDLEQPVMKLLTKENEIKKAGSCLIYEIEPSLLSKKSLCIAVDQSPKLQEMLDLIAGNILTTETGSLLWETKRGDLEYLSHLTGVSKKALEKVNNLNDIQFINLNLGNQKNNEALLEHDTSKPKKYFLILNANPNRPFNTWTNLQDETFIAIDDQVSTIDIYNYLTHEIFMRQDTKYNLQNENSELLMTHHKFINNESKSVHTLADGSEVILNDWEKLLNYQSYIAVRATFSLMRSMIFQEWIWKFLTPKLGTPGIQTNLLEEMIIPMMDNNKCPEVFRDTALKLLPYQEKLINPKSKSFDALKINFSMINKNKIDEIYQYLNDTTLKILDEKTSRIFTPCDFMILPLFSNFILEHPRTPYLNFDKKR